MVSDMKNTDSTLSAPPAPRAWEERWSKKSALRPEQAKAMQEAQDALLSSIDYSVLEPRTLAQAGCVELPPEPIPDLSDVVRSYTGPISVPTREIDAPCNVVAEVDAALATMRRAPERQANKRPAHVRTRYLSRVYEPELFKITIQETLDAMRACADQFDVIAFRGSSGAALAYIAGWQLNKPLLHVRKPGDNSHYSELLEGAVGHRRVAIVDDFVASGETIRQIFAAVRNAYEAADCAEPVFTHLFLYSVAPYTHDASVRFAIEDETIQIVLLQDETY